jgi:hypothetical protein
LSGGVGGGFEVGGSPIVLAFFLAIWWFLITARAFPHRQ